MQNNLWTKGLVIGLIMLFIGISVLPSINANIPIDVKKNDENNPEVNFIPLDQLDQYQTIGDMGYGNVQHYYAQSFKPTLNLLTRIFLRLDLCEDDANQDLKVSIRKNIDGNDITSCLLDISDVINEIDWYECDFPDIQVTPEDTYYIVIHEIPGSNNLVGLNGHRNQGSEDVYSRGEAWSMGYDWKWVKSSKDDYCFKTYGGSPESQLTAEAGGPYSDMVGKTIQFTGSASKGTSPYQYRWDWTNDGTYDTSYSTSKTASRSYSNKGTYTVKLQVRDNIGATSTDTAQVTITSGGNHKPYTPSKPSGPTSGNTGISYTYQTSTTDPDGDQLYYLWDWGDGDNSGWIGPYNSGATATLSHKWTIKGSYSIKVKAKDVYAVESDWSPILTVTITSGNQLTVDAGGPYITDHLTKIQLSGSATGGTPPYKWKWDFGDGTSSSQQNPTHTYPIQNIYNVTLTVTDSARGLGRTLGSGSDDTKVLSGHNYKNKYAVIITGGYNNYYEEYFFKTEADAMENLLQSYGFNINRRSLPSLNDFTGYLHDIAEKETKDDVFVLVLIGHGENQGDNTRFILNNVGSPYNRVWDYELDDWLDGIDCQQIILIECCHSGGFIDDISKKATDDHHIICTACKEDEVYSYDSSEKGWIQSFVEGISGNADYNGDGFYSIEEAFRYSSKAWTDWHGKTQHPLLDDNCDDIGHNHLDTEYTPGIEYGKDGLYSAGVSLNSGPKIILSSILILPLFQLFKNLLHRFPLLERILSQLPFFQKTLNLP